MASPDVLEPPTGLSFGDLLDWHLQRGTRPPGSDKQGEPWKKATFAGDVGVSDKQVRNWIANKSLPNDIITIERVLFGRNQEQRTAWRMELRDALKRTRAGSAPTAAASSEAAPAIRVRADVPASNIPIRVPEHFIGRDDALAVIEAALNRYEGRVAITALHGLRGIGKTTLAAAFSERHRRDYRATWWIRAQTETTMRTDLIALAVRLGWVAAMEKEEPAVAAVMERLRHEGEGVLLIYDNATDADALKPYLPRGGAAKVLVTSNAHAWRGVAVPVEIRLWPKEIGADYLIARTGRDAERAAAEILSETLDGLPLAHEQAAAYCERLDISLSEYSRRFAATPARLLDDARHAPAEYHDGLTVAKTFALAMEEAAKLHPGAEPLIVHAALLAPEPIPLFLFAEAREKFGEPLATALDGDGLDEAVAALRAFALIDRAVVADERDPAITTDTMRLHRLVREVAAARGGEERREDRVRVLIEAVTAVYPEDVFSAPKTWPRARRLDALALVLVDGNIMTPAGAEAAVTELLDKLASFRLSALGAYGEARLLRERVLAIREKVLGLEHPDVASSLNDLGFAIERQGYFAEARSLYERALAINEKVLGPEHLETAFVLHSLGRLLYMQCDFARALSLQERAAAIKEKALGPEHDETAMSLGNLAGTLRAQGDLARARQLHRRVLAIREKVLGPDHPHTAHSLLMLADCLLNQGDFTDARQLLERALAICEMVLGPEHPDTAWSLNELGRTIECQGHFAEARPFYERALAICEKVLGPNHPHTAHSLLMLAGCLLNQRDFTDARPLLERALALYEKAFGSDHRGTAMSLNSLALLLQRQGDLAGARPLRERALAICETVLGPEHPDTAYSLNGLAICIQAQDDLTSARLLHERALTIREKVLGPEHPATAFSLNNLASLLQGQGDLAAARPLAERALAIREKVLGPEHRDTAGSLNDLGFIIQRQGQLAEARLLYERALAIREKVLGPENPETAGSLNNLAGLFQTQGDLAAARSLYERALAIWENVLGPEHIRTNRGRRNFATLLLATGHASAALALGQAALAIHNKVLGPKHSWTKDSARVTADALTALGRDEEATALREHLGFAAE